MTKFGKWLLFALAVAALTARTGAAQEWVESVHNYYVTYWLPDWRQTPPMDSFRAEGLAARLQSLGAEVRLVGQGVAVDDPEYPLDAIRLVAVKYRLATPQEQVTPDPWEARHWQARLNRLGFETRLTMDAPYQPPPPADAGPAPVDLPARSAWTGAIHQEARAMPARLTLNRSGNDVSGELSFQADGQTYRARVRGTVAGSVVSFTTVEALEGRVYVPCEYKARLGGTTMKGTWTYAPDQLEDAFEFVLAQPSP